MEGNVGDRWATISIKMPPNTDIRSTWHTIVLKQAATSDQAQLSPAATVREKKKGVTVHEITDTFQPEGLACMLRQQELVPESRCNHSALNHPRFKHGPEYHPAIFPIVD